MFLFSFFKIILFSNFVSCLFIAFHFIFYIFKCVSIHILLNYGRKYTSKLYFTLLHIAVILVAEPVRPHRRPCDRLHLDHSRLRAIHASCSSSDRLLVVDRGVQPNLRDDLHKVVPTRFGRVREEGHAESAFIQSRADVVDHHRVGNPEAPRDIGKADSAWRSYKKLNLHSSPVIVQSLLRNQAQSQKCQVHF